MSTYSQASSNDVVFNIDDYVEYSDGFVTDLTEQLLVSSRDYQRTNKSSSFGMPQLILEDEDVMEVEVPGQHKRGFFWAIEFGQIKDYDPVICVKALSSATSEPNTCICLGPLVSVVTNNNKDLVLVTENHLLGKWVRVRLPSKLYSSRINVEWAARQDQSVISMSFFPDEVDVDSLLERNGACNISGTDIVSGFFSCWKYGFEHVDEFPIPMSWTVMKMVEEAGLDHDSFNMNKHLVFDGDFHVASCRKWISSLKRKSDKGNGTAKPKITATEQNSKEKAG